MRFEYADSRLPFAVMKAGVLYYLIYDQVGSLKLVADNAGNVVKRIEYDTFGNVISDSSPGFAVPFGFAGGLYDKNTKLVRFGYRDYDPETGRWAAKDPIGFAGGDTDLYGYCLNDPVNGEDPSGLMELPSNPDGLGPEWKVADHYNPESPDQIRFKDSSGRPLDWHPKNPDKSPKTEAGKDHWHDPENFGKKHLYPGDEIPDSKPPLRVPSILPPVRGPVFMIICPKCAEQFMDKLDGRTSCGKDS